MKQLCVVAISGTFLASAIPGSNQPVTAARGIVRHEQWVRPPASMLTDGSGSHVPLLYFLEDRRHRGEVVIHVEHGLTVMDRCRTHQ